MCVSASVSELPGLSLVDRVMQLLNRVDYRRIETAEEKERYSGCATRPTGARGRSNPIPAERFRQPR